MTWFGWATKGRCEISVLDGISFFGELMGVFIIFILLAVFLRSSGISNRLDQ